MHQKDVESEYMCLISLEGQTEPSELRADSCWSDTVSAEEDIRNYFYNNIVRGNTITTHPSMPLTAAATEQPKGKHTCIQFVAVLRLAHAAKLASYFLCLACFQAIQLKHPRGGKNRKQLNITRHEQSGFCDLVPPTARARRYE